MVSVAIIGSGPAGCYMADALARAVEGVRVDVFERLPFPFGLIRYGVAADHQGTKKVTGVLARVMKRPGIRFLGGVEVGKDIALADLRHRYDAVVVATGAASGRKADIPGADLGTSVAALDIARWFNGHPDLKDFLPPVRPSSVCIIGNGNVSLDMARLLAKTPEERAGTDLHPPALGWLDGLRLERITICGRRPAGDTRFSAAELAELDGLSSFAPLVDPEDVATQAGGNQEALAVLRNFARPSSGSRRPLRFLFDLEISSYRDGRLQVARRGGPPFSVEADLLIHAVGQRMLPLPGLPFDAGRGLVLGGEGLVAGTDDVYAVGWAAQAGSGTIAGSRSHAQAVAALVAARLRERGGRAEGAPERSPPPLDRAPVTWEDWTRLDAAEIEAGRRDGCCRRKLVSWAEVEAALSRTCGPAA